MLSPLGVTDAMTPGTDACYVPVSGKKPERFYQIHKEILHYSLL